MDGSLSCIRDKDGHGLSYLLLGTDITEKEHKLRIADQEREASEAEKPKSFRPWVSASGRSLTGI